LRYFSYLSEDQELAAFYKPPVAFTNRSSREVLAHATGAALYTPATRHTIAEDILHQKHEGLVSMVLDLEDAVGDHQVEWAEESLLQQLFKLASYVEIGALPANRVPLLFIRVRSPEQLQRMILRLEERIIYITGFFFPKFTAQNGAAYFSILAEYNKQKTQDAPTLYGSPILESDRVIYVEHRRQTLHECKAILDHYQDYVLHVRIGATDFSSLFGVRRSVHHTVYDIIAIRDCIADIVNVFGRMDADYVISGPVWEYFSQDGRSESMRDERIERMARRYGLQPVTQADFGLVREVLLDKENGIVGKTIIHPSHIRIVQSLYTVTHEEYQDAVSIIDNHDGNRGVFKSEYSNKMNEIKPHLNWAKRILVKADVYGVLHEPENIHSRVAQPGQASYV